MATSEVTPDIGDAPFHPPANFVFPMSVFGDKQRAAQHSWFVTFQWLHYYGDKLYCYYCCKAYSLPIGLTYP